MLAAVCVCASRVSSLAYICTPNICVCVCRGRGVAVCASIGLLGIVKTNGNLISVWGSISIFGVVATIIMLVTGLARRSGAIN